MGRIEIPRRSMDEQAKGEVLNDKLQSILVSGGLSGHLQRGRFFFYFYFFFLYYYYYNYHLIILFYLFYLFLLIEFSNYYNPPAEGAEKIEGEEVFSGHYFMITGTTILLQIS